jgi:hypothetical protein
MANQYSITISNEADAVLRRCKEHGLKTSQVISAAIELLQFDALVRSCIRQRQLAEYLKSKFGDDDE